jgi:hypothetical protein
VAFPVTKSITTREAVLAASQADVLWCCVDTLEARYIADLIGSAFLIPLFEVGVSIPTRKAPGGSPAIADVCGRIDYIQPGRSTLQDRGVYDREFSLFEYWYSSCSRSRAFPIGRQIGRFCAVFRALKPGCSSLWALTRFVDDFSRPVSESKYFVPGGLSRAQNPTALAALKVRCLRN